MESTAGRAAIVQHEYVRDAPRRALDDVRIAGVGLVTAGIDAADLEKMTRGAWNRRNIWPDDKGVTDVDEELEVISAAILVNVMEKLTDTAPKRVWQGPAGNKKKRKIEAGVEPASTEDVVLDDNTPAEMPDTTFITGEKTVKGVSPKIVVSDGEISDPDTESKDQDEDAEDEDELIVLATDGADTAENYWDQFPDDDIKADAAAGLAMGCPSLSAWDRRYWLWSRFDEGIQMDETAWYEMTPEPYAKQIADNLRKIIMGSARLDKDFEAKEDDEDGAVDETFDRRPILNACCGVGGDAVFIAAALPDHKVVCVDIEKSKVDALKKNARIYGCEQNIECVVADVSVYSNTRQKDIRAKTVERLTVAPFIVGGEVKGAMTLTSAKQLLLRPFQWAVVSPPWGGPEYRSCYSFFMSDQTFTDLIKMVQSAMTIADNVCLILPRNQDINEVIHLAAHASPDRDRFNFVHVHRMAHSADLYSFLTVVYLTRDASTLQHLFPTAEAIDELYKKGAAKRFKHLAAVNRPVYDSIMARIKPNLRAPLPNFGVAKTVLMNKIQGDIERCKEIEQKAGHASLPSTPSSTESNTAAMTPAWEAAYHPHLHTLENVVLVKFLLSYLEEPVYQVGGSQLVFNMIGVGQSLNAVAETIRVCRCGGLQKLEGDEQRSKGGVFFQVIKAWFPDAYKSLRKWRKKSQEFVKG